MDLRIRREAAKPGFVLMAEDADRLAQAERGDEEPALRLYTWAEPTLSLGFHQREEVLDRERATADRVPWVRRPTGGAAVLHSEELTYAIVMPLGAARGMSAIVQEYVSRAIAGGLRRLGVNADVDARGEPLSALSNRVSCFVRASRWEITVGGKKVVGSAQRKLTRALLQHGSILIGDDHRRIADYLHFDDEQSRFRLRSRLEEHSTSIQKELGRSVALSEVEEAVASSFERVFSSFPAVLNAAPADLTG